LNYLYNRSDIRLIGKNKIINKNRAPTISFVSKNKSSKEIANKLNANNIATRNDNFYAWRCLKALGIDVNDGVIRISMVHYNSKKETDLLLKALELV
jgi:selenocysteine lyase/cysteine desulfurase